MSNLKPHTPKSFLERPEGKIGLALSLALAGAGAEGP